jgi:Trypsin-co-occurring domain 1
MLSSVKGRGATVRPLVEYQLEGGGSVAVEVEDTSRGALRGWQPEQATARASETLERTIDRVRPAAEAVLKSFRDGAAAPEVVEIEFGIALTAEAGAVIARTQGEVHFRVTLTWSGS